MIENPTTTKEIIKYIEFNKKNTKIMIINFTMLI